MTKIAFLEWRINPLAIASGVFMLLAPFGSWMTLSAFGYISGSNLWQVTKSQTSFPIDPSLPSIALYSSIILIIAGIVSFKWSKYGTALATVALVAFGFGSYSSFGTFPGAIQVSILPGLGVFLSLAGVAIGIGALRTERLPLTNFLASLRTRIGIGQIGIFSASVFLAADGWNHWSTGGVSVFLGNSLLEGAIHRTFFLGVTLLLLVFLIQNKIFLQKSGMVLALVTFSALIADAMYHVTTGSIVDFVGHDPAEIVFHALTYYGIALLVVASVLMKR